MENENRELNNENENTSERVYSEMDLSTATALEVANEIIKILDSKKARDIKLLHVEEQTVLAEYFVVCSGTSSTMIKSLAGELEYKLTLAKNPPIRMDGYAEGSWIVMDFGNILVHIFGRESREFYKLEKFWADSENVDISSLLHE